MLVQSVANMLCVMSAPTQELAGQHWIRTLCWQAQISVHGVVRGAVWGWQRVAGGCSEVKKDRGGQKGGEAGLGGGRVLCHILAPTPGPGSPT